MYEHLRGTMEERAPTRAVVDVGGVGYELTIPLSTFERLPARDAPVTLYTHLHVREDSLKLYGFASPDERRFFRRLLDVSGIGPAVALSILSSADYATFRAAILAEDVAGLTRMKGVGKKLAQRMILELRDTLAKEGGDLPAVGGDHGAVFEDAVSALTTLGFTRGAAAKQVEKLLAGSGEPPPLEEIVRLALRSAR